MSAPIRRTSGRRMCAGAGDNITNDLSRFGLLAKNIHLQEIESNF